ncbi:MAG: hypothetical protein JWO08_1481, partial [Verrucomicrobiaceae bacterium]|nr:hypothetical protein [Verrucomicrobiaceae bacterium]
MPAQRRRSHEWTGAAAEKCRGDEVLAGFASIGDSALRGDHLGVGKSPARRVAKTGGKELIDQPCHGPTLAAAFMIQRTNDGA